ncbi:hypothetical protein [Limosilactobacillus sp.]|uniref:hypothetical protein n=1 Tax=Limosilactobacillus sp. TaxID=2773925 RepID=UPI0025BCDE46|nr:hypothetical protein [Limosilactobacillus sp.]MCH3922347.1 hypothetical protein [Limosilactobacillus sp.]MCH3929119.1 hypothetical protein [Limosilactobacillus sp.]
MQSRLDNGKRKPWYKRWWFWVIAIIFVLAAGGMESGSDDNSSNSSSSNSSSQTSKPAKNTAKEVTLGAGAFKVGQDIKPGRYTVTPTSGSGNFTNKSGSINMILGTEADDNEGQVTSYTVDLHKGETIKLEGIQSTDFKPTPSKRTYQTTLSAGQWKVGQDIKPGRYEIKATQGSGNLTTSDGDINEILGTESDSDTGQVTHVTATLSDGQTLDTELQQIQLVKK